MKYKHLALICAIAAVSLPSINTAQAEAATPVEAHGEAVKEAVDNCSSG